MIVGGRGGLLGGPIGQEIKCAVSQQPLGCQRHVFQVIAYCLLRCEVVRGHGGHINFSLSHLLCPILLQEEKEQRAAAAAEAEARGRAAWRASRRWRRWWGAELEKI